MQFEYENIKLIRGLPIKSFFVDISSREFHWHNEFEIIWCLDKSVNFQFVNDKFTVNSGDLVIINPNEIHSLRSLGESSKLYCLQIDLDSIGDLIFNLHDNKIVRRLIRFDNSFSKDLKMVLLNIVELTVKGNDAALMNAYSKVLLLLSIILDNVEIKQNDINDKSGNKIYSRVNRTIDYINKNYNRKITLSDIATKEHISKYHLSHFIKNNIGISFQELLNRIRLENAVNLLINTKKSVISISEECGFSDVKYLNKLLHEYYNTTASIFRNTGKNILSNNVTSDFFSDCLKLMKDGIK